MRERVTQLAGKRREGDHGRARSTRSARGSCASTGQALGLPRKFTICDASDQLSAVKSAMRELRVHETTMHPSAVLARMSLAKNRMETPEGVPGRGHRRAATSSWARSGSATGSSSRRTRSLDFDDLLLETVRLLREHDDVRAHYRKRYRYVLVDEYQDTNHPQYEIVKQIGGEHRNVCVVGDDDQSIYGWRGADIQKILGFHRDFEGAKVVRLQTNYRSTRPDPGRRQRRHPQERRRATRRRWSRRAATASPCASCASRTRSAEAQFVVREMRRAPPPGGGQAAGLRDPLPHPGPVPALRGRAARERPALRGGRAACPSSTARRCATSSPT